MLGIEWVEWLGYLASTLVLVSLLMSSIIKLRWINLTGALTFGIYGFLIGSVPVGIMNLGIVLINLYYLQKIYGKEEYFQMLSIEPDSEYFQYFLEHYKEDIKKYFSRHEYNPEESQMGFYILRDMVPAGVFLATEEDSRTLKIKLDFVIPEYRDFKVGEYIFEERKKFFLDLGYQRFLSRAVNEKHRKYLKKMGFKELDGAKEEFIKTIG